VLPQISHASFVRGTRLIFVVALLMLVTSRTAQIKQAIFGSKHLLGVIK
jgi:hypothetical protein